MGKRRGKILFFMVVAVVGFWLLAKQPPQKPSEQTPAAAKAENKASNQPKADEPKKFSGEEFKELALSIKYPNVQLLEEPPPITGDAVADEHIRTVAESRGYVLTSIPVNAIQKIHEPNLLGDDLLQPQAAIAWEKLKKMAQAANIPLSMTSAYRSPAYQRDLFMERLLSTGVTVAQIAAGQGEAAIINTLQTAAVPGYSRHHTGYTIDLWCQDGSAQFVDSVCFEWMSADNYQKPKEAGWIPSYPEGAEQQGPAPEAWEYIWVGEEYLRE